MMLEDLYRLLRSSHVQAQGVVDTMTQPVIVLDRNLCVTTANNAFIRTFGAVREDILGQNFFELGDGQWDIAELRSLIASIIPKAAAVIGFEVKHDFPTIGQRTFLVDARRLVHPDDSSSNILILFDDVTERERDNAEKQFIISEARHRMANLFAVVRAIAMQTDAVDRSAIEYRDTFLGRLNAMQHAQDITVREDNANFETLLRESVGKLAEGRLHCDGPTVELPNSSVMTASMIFHELGTNAVKYGALSVPGGEIHANWWTEAASDRDFVVCQWSEEKGPPVAPPTRTGYGTKLIVGTSKNLGGNVELRYDPKGLTAVVKIPL